MPLVPSVARAPAAVRRSTRRHGADLVILGGGLALAVVLGALVTYLQWQVGICLCLLVIVFVVALNSVAAAMTITWSVWAFAPLARRLLDLVQPSSGPDLLAVVPYVLVLTIAVVQLRKTPMPKQLRVVYVLLGTAMLIGVISGLGDTLPMLYAGLAYVAGFSAAFIAYAEVRAGRGTSLGRAFLYFAPVVVAYGLFQYAFPLTPWDQHWLDTAPITSIGTKENDNFRVFSVMNSPGILGPFLATCILYVLTRRNVRVPYALLAAGAGAVLALTLVRSAWIGLVGGLIVLAIAGRGWYLTRVVVVLAVVGVAAAGLASRSTVGAAVVDRANTIGALEQDNSGQARLSTASTAIPYAVRQPAGSGLGSVGQARLLTDSKRLFFPDNGYISLLYQLGVVGTLLVLGPLLYMFWIGLSKRVAREDLDAKLLGLAIAGALIVQEFFGDAMYGVTGVILWYGLGLLIAVPRAEAPD